MERARAGEWWGGMEREGLSKERQGGVREGRKEGEAGQREAGVKRVRVKLAK